MRNFIAQDTYQATSRQDCSPDRWSRDLWTHRTPGPRYPCTPLPLDPPPPVLRNRLTPDSLGPSGKQIPHVISALSKQPTRSSILAYLALPTQSPHSHPASVSPTASVFYAKGNDKLDSTSQFNRRLKTSETYVGEQNTQISPLAPGKRSKTASSQLVKQNAAQSDLMSSPRPPPPSLLARLLPFFALKHTFAGHRKQRRTTRQRAQRQRYAPERPRVRPTTWTLGLVRPTAHR